jgi:hypothetical protein
MESSRLLRRVASLATFLLAAACLPKDTRPPPAELVVSVSASELTLGGIPSSITSDGFAIQFERVLVNLGDEDLSGNGSECNDYSIPSYSRLFDFAQVRAPEELGIAFALGTCELGFGMLAPSPLSKIGTGASVDDWAAMRMPASDRVAKNAGVAVWVSGNAVRGSEREHFSWPFRTGVRYERCGDERGLAAMPPDDAGMDAGSTASQDLVFRGGTTLRVDIQIEVEELFQDHGNPQVPGQHFEPYATADANGDGEISFDELWSVPFSTVREQGLYVPRGNEPDDASQFPCFDNHGDPYTVTTLGDYAYCVLLPRVARYQGGGPCALVTGSISDEGF